ncbi:MAG TPA: glycosyl hydrolase [Parafilimonas sp.]|nr:glycosyl hydrolase [Parafilimonas sp.]
MHKKISLLAVIFYILFCESHLVCAQTALPADKQATQQTINLYNNLKKNLSKGVMLGHQDDLAYGVGWKYEAGRSDIKDVIGDYPAVMGFELGRIELDHPVNLDSVPFDKMRMFIKDAYKHGSVITISWHLNNPLTGQTAWDPSPETVTSVLPGGEKNNLYNSWLDKVAAFFQSLKDDNNNFIPVIFRPFHELNGSWFWWGGKNCTPDEVKQLYQYTEKYLRDTKHVHNLLYAFNTDKFYSAEEYLERFPGDDFTDILGFDIYQRGSNGDFMKNANNMLSALDSIASAHNKIPALTEFGYANLPDSTWWTNVLLPVLKNHTIAYALAWRNAGVKKNDDTEYYVPYKNSSSANDFIKFCNDDKILLQKDAAQEKLYQKN